MAVVMRVGAKLDERATQRVADQAERTFNDAGARAGRGFGQTFQQQVEHALDEKALEKSARRIEAQMTRTGKVSGEAFNQAIANEAQRTGLAADKIGEALTNRLGVHGGGAGRQFATMFLGELGKVAPGVGNALSSVGSIASTAMEAMGGSAVAAAASVASIGTAAVLVTRHLYEIGESFDNVAKSIEIQTGKMGADLQGLTESVDHVATHTASSLGTIGGIAASVSQAFHVTGAPLENLTKQIADLDRMTGTQTNVRDLGKVMRSFGLDANQAQAGLDSLKVASENTGAPMDELLETLKGVGASARSLHLDFGQTAAVIDMFDQAGLDASTTTRGLNKAIAEATKHHVDLQTVLQTSIEDIGKFLAAGDEQKAQELAQKLFGTKGAQQFVDAIRQGKLNVDDLNNSLKNTRDAGHIEKLNDDTLRWADTWTIVKNRIEDALKPLAQPVFDTFQRGMRAWAENPFALHAPGPPPNAAPGSVDPNLQPKPLPSLFPGVPGGPPASGGGRPGQPPGIMSVIPGQQPAAPGTPGGDLSDQLDDTGKPKPVNLPYGPGYGAPPAPGESEEHWRLQQELLEKQHDLAEKRAELDELDKSHVASEDEKIKARNAVAKAQSEADTAQRGVTNYMPKIAIPYGPGYGAAPRPGEPARLYEAEQGQLEAAHKRAEAQATLSQLETNAGATDEQKIKARNDLAAAELAEYNAQMKLREAALGTSKDLGQLGAAIDNDFGISKGIPGIVENLVKTFADVAAAPMLGRLAAFSNINEAQTGISGGYGLLGILGAQNLAQGKSPIFGNPLGGAAGATGFSSIGGGGGFLGNLFGLGGPGLGKAQGTPGYIPGGAPSLNFSPTPATAPLVGPGGAGTSPNGFPLNAPEQAFSVNGVASQGATGGPADRLRAFAQWYNDNIEPVKQLAGYDRGGHGLGAQSNHTSGTALDINWDDFTALQGHGADARTHFGPDKMAAISGALQQFGMTWGQYWTPDSRDPGHFELSGAPYSKQGPQNVGPLAGQPAGGPGQIGGPTDFGAGGTGLSGGAFAAPSAGVVQVYVTNMPGGGIPMPGAPGAGAPGGPPSSTPAVPSGGTGPGGTGPGDPNDPNDNRPGGGGGGKPAPAAPGPSAGAAAVPPPGPTGPPTGPPNPLDPRTYTGGGPGAGPAIPLPKFTGSGFGGGGHLADWDKIAGPEASGNWANNSNPKYKGGLQFDQQTWDRHGGQQYAPRADLATPEQQKEIADRTLAAQGPGAWPATSAAHPDWFHPPTGPGASGGALGVQSVGFNTGAPGPSAGPAGGGGPSPHGGTGAAPGAGPTKIGGAAPPANPAGGQAGITPGGTVDTAIGMAASALDVIAPGAGQAAQVGIKLANRAIQYGAQVAGIGASGLMETFLPTGGSQLAQNSWLSKIASGISGARPAVPNLAGGPGNQAMQPGQGGKDSGKGGGQGETGQTNNITINQASSQPAGDITHALGVQYNNNPAMGR